MHLTVFRTVGLEEIDKAGRAWAAYRGPDRRGKPGTLPGGLPFVAKNWFRFHGRLAVPSLPIHPYDMQIRQFAEFLRLNQNLSPFTVHGYSSRSNCSSRGWQNEAGFSPV